MARRIFGGEQLTRDAARLLGNDRLAPPDAKPSLMDVVRTLAVYIETRAQLGWTDPMIAALLTEAGYPISAATLRSYRKRLRDAHGCADLTGGSNLPGPLAAPLTHRGAQIERAAPPPQPAPLIRDPKPSPRPAPTPPPPPPPPSPLSTPPPSASPKPSGSAPKPRTFSVSGTNLPPDQA